MFPLFHFFFEMCVVPNDARVARPSIRQHVITYSMNAHTESDNVLSTRDWLSLYLHTILRNGADWNGREFYTNLWNGTDTSGDSKPMNGVLSPYDYTLQLGVSR